MLDRADTRASHGGTTDGARPPERDGQDTASVPGAAAGVPTEVRVLRWVQRRAARPATVRAARGLSLVGEHAAGWLLLGTLAALADRPARRRWATATVAVAGAHGASIAVKRVVRRPRPHDPGVAVHVGTPSRLSFPSSHATSTTTAAVLYGGLLGRPAAGLPLVAVMGASRVLLGVHYPTDVLAGTALGAGTAAAARHLIRRGRLGRWRTA